LRSNGRSAFLGTVRTGSGATESTPGNCTVLSVTLTSFEVSTRTSTVRNVTYRYGRTYWVDVPTMMAFSIAGRGRGCTRHGCIVFWEKRTTNTVEDLMRWRVGGNRYGRLRHCWKPAHPASKAQFSNGGGAGDAREGPDPAEATYAKFRLPPPTWSVSDLQLSVDHEPVSDEVLVALCRRACVQVPPPVATVTSGDCANKEEEEREEEETSMRQMAQDVGNLLHMLRQVRSIDPSLAASLLDSTSEEERARLLYDVPRGVSPIVFDVANDDDDDDDDDDDSRSESNSAEGEGIASASWDNDEDAREFDRVRDSLLRPKMVQVGGHSYFAVQTGRAGTRAEDGEDGAGTDGSNSSSGASAL
jgi:hypothetical protein